MIRLKFNSVLFGHFSMILVRSVMIGLFVLFSAPVAWGGAVTPELALRVAQGQVRHHSAIFGNWNGTVAPTISDPETIPLEGGRLAYHFRIHPTGYVIVAADDNLSPTPFYSTRSSFDISRVENPKALEALIVSRLNAKANAAANAQISKAASPDETNRTAWSSRVGNAWTYYDRLSFGEADEALTRNLYDTAAVSSEDVIRGAMVAPLLSTKWAQDSPYNIEMPDDGCVSGHTYTGCVATAWTQLLNYWQWPPRSLGGQGTHTYTWHSNAGETILNADFSDTEAYDWAHMPNSLNDPGTTQEQINAVSKLMYALAVSAEMDFGCTTSGSSRWADEVLDTFFRYKSLNDANNRLDLAGYTSDEWMAIIQNELEADPPRPIIFSIGSQSGWHEVVIDGYQEGVADKVHINFGWEGNEDAYFDITDDDNFNAGGFNWDVEGNQTIVIGIEPDNTPPVIQAEDIEAYEGTEVTLSVTSEDPEGVGVSQYIWTQVSGEDVSIANAESPTPTITTPTLGFFASSGELVFQVKVYDANRAFSTDTCTVTLGRPATGGGGGGGGCFLNLLHH